MTLNRFARSMKPIESLGAGHYVFGAPLGTDNFDFLVEGVPTITPFSANQRRVRFPRRCCTPDRFDIADLKHNTAIVAVTAFASLNAPRHWSAAVRAEIESCAFKLGIVNRMLAGEKVRALGARAASFPARICTSGAIDFLSGGPEALRGPGRPRNSERSALRVGRGSSSARCSGRTGEGAQRVAALERKIGQQQVELDFFSASLCGQVRGARRPSAGPGVTGVYEVIQAMICPLPQGELTIERMCALAGVSRAGY